jgi:hypothetical protein
MTSALEASGPKKYFFAFSILLDGIAHISAIFLLKIQKKSKIGSPYWLITRLGRKNSQNYIIFYCNKGKCNENAHVKTNAAKHIFSSFFLYRVKNSRAYTVRKRADTATRISI